MHHRVAAVSLGAIAPVIASDMQSSRCLLSPLTALNVRYMSAMQPLVCDCLIVLSYLLIFAEALLLGLCCYVLLLIIYCLKWQSLHHNVNISSICTWAALAYLSLTVSKCRLVDEALCLHSENPGDMAVPAYQAQH